MLPLLYSDRAIRFERFQFCLYDLCQTPKCLNFTGNTRQLNLLSNMIKAANYLLIIFGNASLGLDSFWIHLQGHPSTGSNFYRCEKLVSPPGLKLGPLEYSSSALTTKLRSYKATMKYMLHMHSVEDVLVIGFSRSPNLGYHMSNFNQSVMLE